jgi:hypothetical protein
VIQVKSRLNSDRFGDVVTINPQAAHRGGFFVSAGWETGNPLGS